MSRKTPNTNFKHITYIIKGKKIHTSQIGKGKPLLLVHGWSNSWIGWIPLAEVLAQVYNYQIIMVDLPGFGDSDSLPKYSLKIQANYLHLLTKNLHLSKPLTCIIGASLGTLVCAQALKSYPHISNRLILIGTVFSDMSVKRGRLLLEKILNLAHKHHYSEIALGKAVKTKYAAYFLEKFVNNAYKFDREKVKKYNLPGRKKMRDDCYVQMGISGYKFNLENYLKTTEKKL